jgi:hypothetical protein
MSWLCVAVGTISACSTERDPAAEVAAAEPAAARAPVALSRPTPVSPQPSAHIPRRPPVVRRMANGRMMLTPQEPTEVATMQLQPDGTFKQVCGAPSDDDRAALDAAHRNRGGAR